MPKKKPQAPENKYVFDPSIDLDIGNLPKPWTEKQYHFALAYLANGYNATQAAIEAGYSEKTAKQQGHRMLTDADFSHIKEYIAFRQKKKLDKWDFQHDRHIQSTVRQAQMNIFDFATPDPESGELVIDWRKVPYELGELISSVKYKKMSLKTVEGGEEISLPVLETEVKFWDKNTAREQLNKINKLYQSVGDSEDNPMFVKFLNDIPK